MKHKITFFDMLHREGLKNQKVKERKIKNLLRVVKLFVYSIGYVTISKGLEIYNLQNSLFTRYFNDIFPLLLLGYWIFTVSHVVLDLFLSSKSAFKGYYRKIRFLRKKDNYGQNHAK